MKYLTAISGEHGISRKLSGYEFKYGKKTPKAPDLWTETYSNASFEVINRENYFDFIL
jgi:hypothetical protein